MPEYIDIYDYLGNPTGETHVRGEGLKPGQYIAAAMVCIFNKEGKLLIQKRHEEKKNWPGLWDVSASGAMDAGELPQEAAAREAFEELGVTVDLSERRQDIITAFTTGFTHTFIVNMDVKLEDIVMQEEEVQDVRFATRDEIQQMMKEGAFIKYRPSWIDYIFSVSAERFIF